MIMMAHGPDGLKVRMNNLADKAASLSEELDDMGVENFNQEGINIVTIKNAYVSKELASKYRLVSDNFGGKSNWWKIVVMQHVTQGTIDQFLEDLSLSLNLQHEDQSH